MGRVTHPPVVPVEININAPSSNSGCGNFREPCPLDEQNSVPNSPAHPRGPASKLWIAQAGKTPVSSISKSVKPKPPPKTKPSISTLKSKTTSKVDINIKVQVLADGTSKNVDAKSAKTSFNSNGVNWKEPRYKWREKRGKNIITSLSGKFVFKGTITIQTVYGTKAKKTDISLYGRGTTKDDKKRGNVSLGFHESRHQKDFLNYFKNKPFPKFEGKVGMTTTDYDKAVAEFKTAFNKYMNDMDAKSIKSTDEVGYTLSKCKKDKKCKK
ncbi:MAG: hypothetical protein QNK30_17335 [Bacteroidales bacterium]|nr:hypothetical protein [Bacteroidales bacterium]